MQNFRFICPTDFIFGKDTENSVGEEIKKYGKRILLHYGGGHIKKNGLYDRIIRSLKANEIEYVELGGVKANPDVEMVREGIRLCREEKLDFILAAGGICGPGRNHVDRDHCPQRDFGSGKKRGLGQPYAWTRNYGFLWSDTRSYLIHHHPELDGVCVQDRCDPFCEICGECLERGKQHGSS